MNLLRATGVASDEVEVELFFFVWAGGIYGSV